MTPAEEEARAALLKSLADELNETAAETDKLMGEVSPEAKPALQRMTESAREGQKKIEAERRGANCGRKSNAAGAVHTVRVRGPRPPGPARRVRPHCRPRHRSSSSRTTAS